MEGKWIEALVVASRFSFYFPWISSESSQYALSFRFVGSVLRDVAFVNICPENEKKSEGTTDESYYTKPKVKDETEILLGNTPKTREKKKNEEKAAESAEEGKMDRCRRSRRAERTPAQLLALKLGQCKGAGEKS